MQAAASKSVSAVERLSRLLRTTGYIQQVPSECRGGGSRYSFGPAGTLLRHNILQSWWTKMVACAESTFPVSGAIQDPLQYYHSVCDLANQQVPFSLLHKSTHENTAGSKSLENNLLLDSSVITSLRIVNFCAPGCAGTMFDEVVNMRMQWWKQCSSNLSHFHLADATTSSETGSHIVYQFPWGEVILETILNKGDNPLKQLEAETGTSSKCEIDNKCTYPHQIDTVTSLEAAMSVFLHNAYTEKASLEQGEPMRQILQLHPLLAPFKVAVTTDGSKGRELQEVAKYINRQCRNAGVQLLNVTDTGQLDTKIKGSDRLGIPFMAVVSDSTLATGAIGMRNRDTTITETLAINKITDYLRRRTT